MLLSNLLRGSLDFFFSASSAIFFFESLEGDEERDPAGVLAALWLERP